MKCKYCGSNLGLMDEHCPYCGRENVQAEEYVKSMKDIQKELDEEKKSVQKKKVVRQRISRAIIIAFLASAVMGMLLVMKKYSDPEERFAKRDKITAELAEKNREEIVEKLRSAEENREYLAIRYLGMAYRLNHDDRYKDYSDVFLAAESYELIYSSILNILDGFDQYGANTKQDWCYIIAGRIADWHKYVERDTEKYPMHLREHGAFQMDAKKDVQDMVQVYFQLTNEQVTSMWTMEREEIGTMLYEKCKILYPEVGADA